MAAACVAAAFLAAPPAPATADKLGTHSLALSMALQPNGRIVVAGATQRCDVEDPFCTDPTVIVVRFRPSGKIDRSFGGGDGLVKIPVGGDYTSASYPGVSGLAIQDDGKIVVGAVTNVPRSSLLARLSAKGKLDRGFGEGGTVVTPPERFVASESGNGIVIAADGSILVAGSHDPVGPETDFAAARYLPDGALDPGFGAAGVASVNVSEGLEGSLPYDEAASAIGLHPDGRILLGGGAGNGFVASIAAAQLDVSGQPDQGFGSGGRAVFANSGPTASASARAVALEIQPDGSALFAGMQGGVPCAFALARLGSDGAPVQGFGDAGIVLSSSPGCGGATGLALQGEKILVTGPGDYVVVVRYHPDGSWDTGFAQGAGGTDFKVAGFPSGALALAVAKGGRILAAGYVRSDHCALAGGKGKGSRLCRAITLLQLKPNGRLDRKFGRGGIMTAPTINLCEKAPTKRCGAGKRARR